METMKVKARKWGNSVGFIIPKDVAKRENIQPGRYVEILIPKKTDILKKTFGTLKFKKTAQQMKDELRRELYD